MDMCPRLEVTFAGCMDKPVMTVLENNETDFDYCFYQAKFETGNIMNCHRHHIL